LHLYGLLKQADSRYHLSVIGHCHSKSIRNQLEKASDTEPSIHLIGLDNHVEHHLIQDTIQSAGLALICYTPNAINRFRVPSKLYEYTQMNVPFVVDVRTHWYRLARDYSGCIGLDFENPDIPFLINSLADHAQFPKLLPIEFSSWQEEEGKLLSLIDSLF
ncbi:MAG: hypothetical protein OEY56_14635, partial [Cyclobacteriaceae bacterium]|nr:hypothetical protein [Cyclobacteriaceae bacterium]